MRNSLEFENEALNNKFKKQKDSYLEIGSSMG
jgi:hypothetical protein